jgi:hypothetical protein
MYFEDEVSCINLLLQYGNDILGHKLHWNCSYLEPHASTEASQWWYNTFIKEVINIKNNLSNVANAISVISALMALASYIGPLQAPLGINAIDGFVQTNLTLLQVYLVSN